MASAFVNRSRFKAAYGRIGDFIGKHPKVAFFQSPIALLLESNHRMTFQSLS
jgi:hypothetical protein